MWPTRRRCTLQSASSPTSQAPPGSGVAHTESTHTLMQPSLSMQPPPSGLTQAPFVSVPPAMQPVQSVANGPVHVAHELSHAAQWRIELLKYPLGQSARQAYW